MDELDALRAVATPPTASDDPRLASARSRLRSEIRRSQVRRFWRPAALVAAAAAAVLVAALPGEGRPPAPSPPMVPAAQVLELAAVASLTRADRVPRPDQYIYSRWEGWGGQVGESWQSVDGTRDGLQLSDGEPPSTIFGCRNGKRPVVMAAEEGPIPGAFEECEPEPAYDPRIPGDTAGMVAFLQARNAKDDPASTVNSTGKDIMEMSMGLFLRPAQRAALLRAAALIPGLTTAPTTGPGGRPCVSVSWDFGSGPEVLLFDARSHELIGNTAGRTVLDIVDRVGQRP